MRHLAVPLAAALALLSGCVAGVCESPPPVSARVVALGAPSQAGDGGSAVTVLVREESPDGAPLAGAGVVLFWGDESSRDAAGLVQVGPGGVAASGSAPVAPPRHSSTLALRTDSEGRATGHVPSGRIVGVVAAAPGYTEEAVPAFASGDGPLLLAVPLFHDRLAGSANATLATGALSTSVASPAGGRTLWYPDHPLFTRDYLARIVSLRVTLNWTNGPAAFGDFGVAVGRTTDTIDRASDSRREALPGAYSETLTLGLDELDRIGLLGAEHLLAGPYSETGYLAPFGLPYTISWEARFETRSAFERQCGFNLDAGGDGQRASPAPVAALLAAGLLGLAAAVRRSR